MILGIQLLFLIYEGGFFRFCPKADKTYFFRDGKTGKNQAEKTALEKIVNLDLGQFLYANFAKLRR